MPIHLNDYALLDTRATRPGASYCQGAAKSYSPQERLVNITGQCLAIHLAVESPTRPCAEPPMTRAINRSRRPFYGNLMGYDRWTLADLAVPICVMFSNAAGSMRKCVKALSGLNPTAIHGCGGKARPESFYAVPHAFEIVLCNSLSRPGRGVKLE